MKIKSLTLFIICFLALQNIVAQQPKSYSTTQEKWDYTLASPKIYVLPTGDEYIDGMVKAAMEKYWTATPFDFLTDDNLTKDRIPIILFLNKAQSKEPGYQDETCLILGNYKDLKSGYIDMTWSLITTHLNPPTDKTMLKDISFMIPFTIKEINDDFISHKKSAGSHSKKTPASVLKEKTLLIPDEMANKKQSRQIGSSKVLIPEKSLVGYKYTYKIMPLSQIRDIIADSSEASKYCFLSLYNGGPGGGRYVYIYDCASNDCILKYFNNASNMSMNLMSDTDFKKICDMIDAAPRETKR